MIKYSNEEGFIKTKGIKFRDGQNKDIILPSVAVLVFSRHLYKNVIEKFQCEEVGYIPNANLEKNVYILKYKNKKITFTMAGVGAPIIAADIEDLSYSGVKTFIIFGNCGVLDKTIEDCSIIIPTKAFRDEGTSYHYIEKSDIIDINDKYQEQFIKILNKYNFKYTKGYTWTTDAFYRETKEKIKYFKSNGAICVEMEGSAIAAVCKRKNLDYFTFYYAGDNLDAVEWEERSINGLTNIDKKDQVMNLALELAHKLS